MTRDQLFWMVTGAILFGILLLALNDLGRTLGF